MKGDLLKNTMLYDSKFSKYNEIFETLVKKGANVNAVYPEDSFKPD